MERRATRTPYERGGSRRRHAAVVTVASLLALSSLWACRHPVDLQQSLDVIELTGGWYDAGVVTDRHKLVPTVTFRLTKRIDQQIRPLSLNVVFKRIVPEGEVAFDDVFLQRLEFEEGDRTAPLVVRAEAGYTADPPQTGADIFQHSEFQDVRAVISVRQTGPHWTEIARYDLPRQIVAN